MHYLDAVDEPAIQALIERSRGMSMPSIARTAAVRKTSPSRKRPAHRHRRVQAAYLFRLEHPVSTPQHMADILGHPYVPRLETGTGEEGKAHVCRPSQFHIDALDSWPGEHYPTKKSTKVRFGIAHKDALDLPTLGRDPTHPCHRPSTPAPLTKQDTNQEDAYPVTYFFYGSRALPSRLSRLFAIPSSQPLRLKPATLIDGEIWTWAGKYRALVDCPGQRVDGYVYPVMSTDQEDALRVYGGDGYEVVRASVMWEGEEMEVRTFRFCGLEDELTRRRIDQPHCLNHHRVTLAI